MDNNLEMEGNHLRIAVDSGMDRIPKEKAKNTLKIKGHAGNLTRTRNVMETVDSNTFVRIVEPDPIVYSIAPNCMGRKEVTLKTPASLKGIRPTPPNNLTLISCLVFSLKNSSFVLILSNCNYLQTYYITKILTWIQW